MGLQPYSEPLLPLIDAAGVSYNTSTTLTAISPGGAANPYKIPGNKLQDGSYLEVHAWGTISTSGTTPTFLWGVYYGGTAGTILAATTAFTLSNQAGVAWPWELHYEGRVTATGTSGSINGLGYVNIATSLTAFTPRRIPESSPGTGVTIDTTVVKDLVIGGTWGTSAGTNIAFCHGMRCTVHG